MIGNQTNWEFCLAWYKAQDIHNAINSPNTGELSQMNEIPTDVKSMEFADWLCNQYRLAMNKGMEIMEREIKRRSEAPND